MASNPRPNHWELLLLSCAVEAQRQKNSSFRAPTFAAVHGETAGSVGVEAKNALAGYGQAEPGRLLQRPRRRKAHAVVAYANLKLVIEPLRGDGDSSAGGALRETVANGILHQGLQHETGNGCVFHLRRDLYRDAQTVAEADLLNGQIGIEKGQLFHERDLVAVFVFEGET